MENAPVLVAAAKLEPGTAPVNRVEATQLQPSPTVQTIANVAKIEPASTQSVVANPFQSIKQVAVRNEAVLDGSGKVVVNEPLTSPAPVVSARVAPENSSISAPATTTPFAVAPSSSTMARSTVENNDSSNRPPVIVASQLVVKDPVTRIEASKPAQPVVDQNSGFESTAPSINPTVRGDNAPVLVAAARVEPVANPANRGEATLSQPSPAPQSAVTVAKVEPVSTQPLSTNPLPANPFSQ
ncbi:MAG: hypothetical protein IPJ49_20110 [Candidatus Obscuribacter sp.]|nr:hypothetical protein [Candidatus Obscuribacter sp.]